MLSSRLSARALSVPFALRTSHTCRFIVPALLCFAVYSFLCVFSVLQVRVVSSPVFFAFPHRLYLSLPPSPFSFAVIFIRAWSFVDPTRLSVDRRSW